MIKWTYNYHYYYFLIIVINPRNLPKKKKKLDCQEKNKEKVIEIKEQTKYINGWMKKKTFQ